jgi:hypothetical protein
MEKKFEDILKERSSVEQQDASHTAEGTNYPKVLHKIKKFKDLKKHFDYEKLNNILIVGEIISFEDVLKCFCPKDINEEDFFDHIIDSGICWSWNEYSAIDIDKLLNLSSLPYEAVITLDTIEEGNIIYGTHNYYFLSDINSGIRYLIRQFGHDIYCDHQVMNSCKIYQKNDEILFTNKSQFKKIRDFIINDIYEIGHIPDYFNVYWHDLLLPDEVMFGVKGSRVDKATYLGDCMTFNEFYTKYLETDPFNYPQAVINGELAQPIIYRVGKTSKTASAAFFKKILKD